MVGPVQFQPGLMAAAAVKAPQSNAPNPAQFNGFLQNVQVARGANLGFAYRTGLSKEVQDRGLGFLTQLNNGDFANLDL